MNYTNNPNELYHWKYINKFRLPSGKWQYVYSKATGALNSAGRSFNKTVNKAKRNIGSFTKKSINSVSKYANKGRKFVDSQVKSGRKFVDSQVKSGRRALYRELERNQTLQKIDRKLGKTTNTTIKNENGLYVLRKQKGLSGKIYGQSSYKGYRTVDGIRKGMKANRAAYGHERLIEQRKQNDLFKSGSNSTSKSAGKGTYRTNARPGSNTYINADRNTRMVERKNGNKWELQVKNAATRTKTAKEMERRNKRMEANGGVAANDARSAAARRRNSTNANVQTRSLYKDSVRKNTGSNPTNANVQTRSLYKDSVRNNTGNNPTQTSKPNLYGDFKKKKRK